mmetsp:Transcript_45886/g.99401  ORF Transcript_45886/g.99401 Transcript_45886/m.99401 type:complete len:201 (-) Transcript_45886:37-639(-)
MCDDAADTTPACTCGSRYILRQRQRQAETETKRKEKENERERETQTDNTQRDRHADTDTQSGRHRERHGRGRPTACSLTRTTKLRVSPLSSRCWMRVHCQGKRCTALSVQSGHWSTTTRRSWRRPRSLVWYRPLLASRHTLTCHTIHAIRGSASTTRGQRRRVRQSAVGENTGASPAGSTAAVTAGINKKQSRLMCRSRV